MGLEDQSPRSLARVLGLFEALAAADGGLTLTQLSTALDAPKSSLLLLLKPLVAMGYLEHGAARYTRGAAVFRMAASILSARRFPRLIRPYMEALVARTRESVLTDARMALGAQANAAHSAVLGVPSSWPSR
jgi:DNA-binding IclR family transcriptional regulator